MAFFRCRDTEKIELVPWSTGTDEEIKKMVDGYHAGKVSLDDIKSVWSVGDERTVQLASISAYDPISAQDAQSVKFVIMNFGGKTLSNNNTCLAIVGQKDNLFTKSYMNKPYNMQGGWDGCDCRYWCNNNYRQSIPADFRALFKQFKSVASKRDTDIHTAVTSIDYFALPAEREVFGSNTYSSSTAEASLSQFAYYTTRNNRKKKQWNTYTSWWLRSAANGYIDYCCCVNQNGDADYGSVRDNIYCLSPFGCI